MLWWHQNQSHFLCCCFWSHCLCSKYLLLHATIIDFCTAVWTALEKDMVVGLAIIHLPPNISFLNTFWSMVCIDQLYVPIWKNVTWLWHGFMLCCIHWRMWQRRLPIRGHCECRHPGSSVHAMQRNSCTCTHTYTHIRTHTYTVVSNKSAFSHCIEFVTMCFACIPHMWSHLWHE